MRTIIAGSRSCTDPTALLDALDKCSFEPTLLLCGMAPGVDRLGLQWAKDCEVPIEEYPANWDRFKEAAGTIRNVRMAEKAEALIAIWDGHSPGTKHMITIAKHKKLKVYVHLI